jgi:transposase
MDWLPQDHLARFILDVVDELDLSAIVAKYEREERGYPPHHPKMMVALLLYAYSVGAPSSRKIEKRCHEDIGFRVIAANTAPDHSRISDFRRRHLEALSELFVQVLRLCQKAGLVKLGHVALDGTKIKANASKHKAMSYERMKKEEARLREKVAALLAEAEAVDTDEDAKYGKDRRGDELPAELARAQGRREVIRKAMRELEEEAKAQSAETPTDDDDEPPTAGVSELPTHRIPAERDGTPKGKAQRNFTDGDSRIMKTGDGFIQGYNAQCVVDGAAQVIVAQAVTNQPPDAEHFIPMLEQAMQNCGERPRATSADAGYCSEHNIEWALNQGLGPHIATGRTKDDAELPTVQGRPPKTQTLRQQMARLLSTRRGKKVYSRRKVIAEPPFGQIKNRGFRQFLLRGIGKVSGEWSLITTSHNLLKLYAACTA